MTNLNVKQVRAIALHDFNRIPFKETPKWLRGVTVSILGAWAYILVIILVIVFGADKETWGKVALAFFFAQFILCGIGAIGYFTYRRRFEDAFIQYWIDRDGILPNRGDWEALLR